MFLLFDMYRYFRLEYHLITKQFRCRHATGNAHLHDLFFSVKMHLVILLNQGIIVSNSRGATCCVEVYTTVTYLRRTEALEKNRLIVIAADFRYNLI